MRRILKFLVAALTASLTGSCVYTLATLSAKHGGAAVIGLLILPHILAALVLYAAALALFPALALGSALSAASTICPATRTTWFWAGTGGIAALALFPYLESFGRDPVSGWIESGSAVFGGMLAMVAFRGVLGIDRIEGQERPSIDPSMFVAAGVLGVLLVGAVTRRAVYDDAHQFEVRPASVAISKATADMTPVDVTLHEYAESETDPRYMTTGKSLTMRFARSYLSDVNAQAGGALTEIRIVLRKDNFAPLGDVRARRDGVNRADAQAAATLLDEMGTHITLWKIPHSSGSAVKAKILANSPSSNLGEQCGLRFVSEGRSRLSIRPGLALPAGLGIPPDLDVVAVAPASGDHGVATFHCNAHQEDCRAEFAYRGFPGDFWLPKARLCAWRVETSRVFAFLDKHFVSETARRAGE